MPEVIFKIFDDCADLRIAHPDDFRQYVYTIIDDETFIRRKLDKTNDIDIRARVDLSSLKC